MAVTFNSNIYTTPSSAVGSTSYTAPADNVTNSVFDSEKTEQKVTRKDGPTVEEIIERVYGVTREKFNKLPEEEKQNLYRKALKDVVSWNNADKTKEKMTESEQYLLYIQRAKTPEEAVRLAQIVKSMDKDNQFASFLNAAKNVRPEFKDILEKTFANDAAEYHEENVPKVAKVITETYSDENKAIAANGVKKAKVELQNGLIDIYMSAKSEKVDNALAANVGEYGIDKDGKVNDQVQLLAYKQVNKSEFESALKTAAQNIYKLDDKNKSAATEITKATGNKNAISAITLTAPVETKTSSQAVSESPKYDIKEAIASNDKNAIKVCLDTMSQTEIGAFLQENKDSGIINTLLDSNPSVAVLNEINKVIRTSNSANYKTAAKEISFLDLTNQVTMVKQAAANNDLGTIKRTFLSLNAKREYDNQVAKTQIA